MTGPTALVAHVKLVVADSAAAYAGGMTTSSDRLRNRAHTDAIALRTVTVDDLEFGVATSHAPSSTLPAIVLLHGVGMSERSQLPLHRALSADATVHSIRLPGFGGAAHPGRDVTIEQMAESLVEVIARTGSPRVIVSGHSMGAQWAVETALRAPDGLVCGAVLIGPVADDRHRTARAQGRALALDGPREPASVNALVVRDYLRCGMRWFARHVRHMVRYATDDRAALLGVPVLLVRGSRDPIAGPEWLARLQRRIPRSAVVEVRGQGHHAQMTAPEEVAVAILGLAATCDGIASSAVA